MMSTLQIALRRTLAVLLPFILGIPAVAGVPGWTVPPAQEPREQRPPPLLVARNLAEDPHFKLGYLNVRHYARGDGVSDDTAALRQALADGLDYGLALYFPPGTYLVSETLDCVKKQKSYVKGYFLLGDPANRAVIKLKDGARGFGNAEKPRYVVKLWQWDARSVRPDGEFGAALMNSAGVSSIIIDCGAENPGAIGLKCWGSQGIYVENLTVRAHGALAGIRDLVGNGGYMANIEVLGGRYGIWAENGQPGCIAGLTLVDQEEAAIRQNMSTWAYSVAGFKIVKERGPVVVIEKKPAQNSGHHLSMIDGTVELKKPGTAFVVRKDASGRAGNLYLRNVYVKNAAVLVDEQGAPPLPATAGRWSRIAEYASSSSDTQSVVNGQLVNAPVMEVDSQAAAPNLMARHALPAHALLFGLDRDACNVRDESRGAERALGDGVQDDTAAIQHAIDQHRKVFLPRGVYRLTAPLRLRKDTILFGVTSALSALYADARHWQVGQERTVITTVDDADARCVAAQLYVYTSSTEPAGGQRVLHWRAGRDSVVKNLFTKSVDWPGIGWPSVKLDFSKGDMRPVNVEQLALIDSNGGGRWYGICIGCEHYCPVVPRSYRHCSVIGTHEPLRFYSLNPEHAFSDVEFEILDSRDIGIFGVKTEGGEELLKFNSFGSSVGALFRISGCRDVFITAMTNNGKIPQAGRALFEIDHCEDIVVTTLSVARRGQGDYAVLRDEASGRASSEIPAAKNVGLFRQGRPVATQP